MKNLADYDEFINENENKNKFESLEVEKVIREISEKVFGWDFIQKDDTEEGLIMLDLYLPPNTKPVKKLESFKEKVDMFCRKNKINYAVGGHAENFIYFKTNNKEFTKAEKRRLGVY